ncbi:MAG: amidohydrolase family protein [Dehalococcoidia bacterium]
MTIDIHTHLWVKEHFSDTWWKTSATFLSQATSQMERSGTPQEVLEKFLPESFDPRGEICVRLMDEAEIEKSVIMPIDCGLGLGEGSKSIEEQNRDLASVAKRYPGRFIFFCSIDPRREGALDFLEKAVKEWDAKGFKLQPVMGQLYPWDEAAYPLYQRLSQLGLPVLTHVGPMFEPLDSKYGHPRELDRVLRDFPNLTIIAAHIGYAWWRELIEVAQKRPNLVCDFSNLQNSANENYGRFCHVLRRVLDGFGKDRVLFGTDGPFWDPWLSRKWWVDLIKNLPTQAPEGSRFTEEEINAMLYGSAQKLLASPT